VLYYHALKGEFVIKELKAIDKKKSRIIWFIIIPFFLLITVTVSSLQTWTFYINTANSSFADIVWSNTEHPDRHLLSALAQLNDLSDWETDEKKISQALNLSPENAWVALQAFIINLEEAVSYSYNSETFTLKDKVAAERSVIWFEKFLKMKDLRNPNLEEYELLTQQIKPGYMAAIRYYSAGSQTDATKYIEYQNFIPIYLDNSVYNTRELIKRSYKLKSFLTKVLQNNNNYTNNYIYQGFQISIVEHLTALNQHNSFDEIIKEFIKFELIFPKPSGDIPKQQLSKIAGILLPALDLKNIDLEEELAPSRYSEYAYFDGIAFRIFSGLLLILIIMSLPILIRWHTAKSVCDPFFIFPSIKSTVLAIFSLSILLLVFTYFINISPHREIGLFHNMPSFILEKCLLFFAILFIPLTILLISIRNKISTSEHILPNHKILKLTLITTFCILTSIIYICVDFNSFSNQIFMISKVCLIIPPAVLIGAVVIAYFKALLSTSHWLWYYNCAQTCIVLSTFLVLIISSLIVPGLKVSEVNYYKKDNLIRDGGTLGYYPLMVEARILENLKKKLKIIDKLEDSKEEIEEYNPVLYKFTEGLPLLPSE
jgi:hypothetical protein